MKVLHLITSLSRGGIEKWLLSMLSTIPRDTCQMDVCCKGHHLGDLDHVAKQYQAQVLHCKLDIPHLGFMKQLRRVLVDGKYNILHNHVQAYSGFPVYVAHGLRTPVVTTFHNTHFAPQTKLTRLPLVKQLRGIYLSLSVDYALRHSDYVTYISKGVLDTLDPHRTKIKGKHRILYYGTRMPELAKPEELREFRASFGWDNNTPIVLHVGRFVEQKNHIGVLAIFERVLSEIPQAKLLLVGNGPLQARIKETVTQKGLSGVVRFLGARDDALEIMTMCDVFLLPSNHEGFGLVALEANGAALPVVGSRIPGLTEAVCDGETACLHLVQDIEGMAESVVGILQDREYAQRIADAGRKRVKEFFSVERSAINLLEIYKTIYRNG